MFLVIVCWLNLFEFFLMLRLYRFRRAIFKYQISKNRYCLHKSHFHAFSYLQVFAIFNLVFVLLKYISITKSVTMYILLYYVRYLRFLGFDLIWLVSYLNVSLNYITIFKRQALMTDIISVNDRMLMHDRKNQFSS